MEPSGAPSRVILPTLLIAFLVIASWPEVRTETVP